MIKQKDTTYGVVISARVPIPDYEALALHAPKEKVGKLLPIIVHEWLIAHAAPNAIAKQGEA